MASNRITLPAVERCLDLADLRQHLTEYYSHTERPSIDPELMIRMLVIGYYFGSFRYRDSQSGEMAVRTVSGATFLWLILQHVLPKGFRRARNFGFLNPNCKGLIALLQVVLKVRPDADLSWMKPRPPFLCACCGAPMQVVRRRIPSALDQGRGASLAEGVSV